MQIAQFAFWRIRPNDNFTVSPLQGPGASSCLVQRIRVMRIKWQTARELARMTFVIRCAFTFFITSRSLRWWVLVRWHEQCTFRFILLQKLIRRGDSRPGMIRTLEQCPLCTAHLWCTRFSIIVCAEHQATYSTFLCRTVRCFDAFLWTLTRTTFPGTFPGAFAFLKQGTLPVLLVKTLTTSVHGWTWMDKKY